MKQMRLLIVKNDTLSLNSEIDYYSSSDYADFSERYKGATISDLINDGWNLLSTPTFDGTDYIFALVKN